MSVLERCTPGRGHFMRFGDSQCECGEKRVYRNVGAQTVSSEPASVCPHCHLPAVLPEVCSLEIHEAIEAGITEAWELFEAGRQHEAKHRLVPVSQIRSSTTTGDGSSKAGNLSTMGIDLWRIEHVEGPLDFHSTDSAAAPSETPMISARPLGNANDSSRTFDDASQHTGDCRRWRLVTGHRREYQGSHACTCGASSQREEPPT